MCDINSFSLVGIPCLYSGSVITSPSVSRIDDSLYIISVGFLDDIDPDLLSSVQCNTTLKCLNCTVAGLNMNLDECITTVSFIGIPRGSYNISIDTRISTSCGEEIFSSPIYFTYMGMLYFVTLTLHSASTLCSSRCYLRVYNC